MNWLSKIVIVCLIAALLTVALMTLFTARSPQIEKSVAAAETPRGGGIDADALGSRRLVGSETIE